MTALHVAYTMPSHGGAMITVGPLVERGPMEVA